MFAVFRWLGQKTNFLYYLFCTLRSGGLDILRKLNSDVAKGNPTVGYSGALVSFNCQFDTAYSHLKKRMSIKGLTRSGLWACCCGRAQPFVGGTTPGAEYEEAKCEPVIKPIISARSSRVSPSSSLNNELWAGCVS